MPLSELPALKALVARPSSGEPNAHRGKRGANDAGGDMPRCPKCAEADQVEPEGRSGECGLWFKCRRCEAIFFGYAPAD